VAALRTGILTHCREQNNAFGCRTFVPAGSVSSSRYVHSGMVFSIPEISGSGVKAHAPQLGYPGRGHQLHGHQRSKYTTARTPLGTAFCVPNRARHRVGLGCAACEHARRQRKRHVHRIRRPALDWRGIFSESSARPSGARGLPRTPRRTRPRHGRVGFLSARTADAVSGADQQTFAVGAWAGTGRLTVYSPA
jgi:hypothetical protein